MTPLFYVAGLICILGALGVVLAKQPVHQVLSTVVSFVGLAALYLSLQSEFMAVIQMIIYGGAVMILFLFVIALLTARKDPLERSEGNLSGQTLLGYVVGGAVLLLLVGSGVGGKLTTAAASVDGSTFGSVQQFGHELLTTHVLPFELTAFVLMVAVIGVVVLVGRQKA